MLEVVLNCFVRFYRKQFQWLINEEDTLPSFPRDGLLKFLSHSYDRELGWVRKPNSSGADRCGEHSIPYSIGDDGARSTFGTLGEPKIAVFGDSYAFCRQVEDDATWENILGCKVGSHVLNYGVGNYGVDQALLRYEGQNLPNSIKIVCMAFVPETICRVLSCWKHYSEFGNIFAFKPMFYIVNGELRLMPNVMANPLSYYNIKGAISAANERDYFYRRKFRKLQFRFPYSFSFFRAPARHSLVLIALMMRSVRRFLGIKSANSEDSPFNTVMRHNIKIAHNLYGKNQSECHLLLGILERFCTAARSRGHIPVLVVFPQLIDVLLYNSGKCKYSHFYNQISDMKVIDFTSIISSEDYRLLYTNDCYGGHFSERGNAFVANALHGFLSDIL